MIPILVDGQLFEPVAVKAKPARPFEAVAVNARGDSITFTCPHGMTYEAWLRDYVAAHGEEVYRIGKQLGERA